MEIRIVSGVAALLGALTVLAGSGLAASIADRCDTLQLSYKDNEKLLQTMTLREHALSEIINMMENSKSTMDNMQEQLESLQFRIQKANEKIKGGDSSAETAADLKSLQTSQDLVRLRMAPTFNANTFYDQPKYHELETTLSKLKGSEIELTKKREELKTTMKGINCSVPKADADMGGEVSTDVDEKDGAKSSGTDLTGDWTAEVKVPGDNCTISYTMTLKKTGPNTWTGPIKGNTNCAGAANQDLPSISLSPVSSDTLDIIFMGKTSQARLINSKILVPFAFVDIVFTKKR